MIVARSLSAAIAVALTDLITIVAFRFRVVSANFSKVIMALLAAPVAVFVILIIARAHAIIGFEILVVAVLVQCLISISASIPSCIFSRRSSALSNTASW